jgi:hypothetical protein
VCTFQDFLFSGFDFFLVLLLRFVSSRLCVFILVYFCTLFSFCLLLVSSIALFVEFDLPIFMIHFFLLVCISIYILYISAVVAVTDPFCCFPVYFLPQPPSSVLATDHFIVFNYQNSYLVLFFKVSLTSHYTLLFLFVHLVQPLSIHHAWSFV